MRGFLYSFFQVIGWALILVGLISYLVLWIEAFEFYSKQIGTLLTWLLVLFTNIVSPVVYIIWVWISGEFPGRYVLILLGANIIFTLGNFINKMAQKYLDDDYYFD